MTASARTRLVCLVLAMAWTSTTPATAGATNGTTSVHFRISAGQRYCSGQIDELGPVCEYVGAPDTCPVAGVTFLWGGHWINLPVIGWVWLWGGGTPLTGLVPEQVVEFKSVCGPTGCFLNANIYCDYPSPSQIGTNFSMPPGGVQASLKLACPDSSLRSATPAAATSPISTLASGGHLFIDLGARIGNGFSSDGDALSYWRSWAASCGLPPP
jgi:hypothetical protein